MVNQHDKVDLETVAEALLKSALGLIPYAGTLLTEAVMYRSQVKQKRLNRFLELISQYVAERGGIEPQQLSAFDKEQFGDLLEAIIRRVVQTRSEEKLKHFAKIAAQAISDPIEEDYTETFLDLIARLSEKQIEILVHFDRAGDQYTLRNRVHSLENSKIDLIQQVNKEYGNNSKGWANNYLKVKSDLEAVEKELSSRKPLVQQNDRIQQGSYYGISDEQYRFLIQDLYSKSLLIDIGVGAIDTRPFEIMAITSFGSQLLLFLSAS